MTIPTQGAFMEQVVSPEYLSKVQADYHAHDALMRYNDVGGLAANCLQKEKKEPSAQKEKKEPSASSVLELAQRVSAMAQEAMGEAEHIASAVRGPALCSQAAQDGEKPVMGVFDAIRAELEKAMDRLSIIRRAQQETIRRLS